MRKKFERKELDPKKEQELRKYAFIALGVFILFIILQFLAPKIKSFYLPNPQPVNNQNSTIIWYEDSSNKALQNTQSKRATSDFSQDELDVINLSKEEIENLLEKRSTLTETDLSSIFTKVQKSTNLSTSNSSITISPSAVTIKILAEDAKSVTITTKLSRAQNSLELSTFAFSGFPPEFNEELKKQIAQSFANSLDEYIKNRLKAYSVSKIYLGNAQMDIVYL